VVHRGIFSICRHHFQYLQRLCHLLAQMRWVMLYFSSVIPLNKYNVGYAVDREVHLVAVDDGGHDEVQRMEGRSRHFPTIIAALLALAAIALVAFDFSRFL
jgi:hypothetical protein